jgi:hypothetical protein
MCGAGAFEYNRICRRDGCPGSLPQRHDGAGVSVERAVLVDGDEGAASINLKWLFLILISPVTVIGVLRYALTGAVVTTLSRSGEPGSDQLVELVGRLPPRAASRLPSRPDAARA